MTEDNSNIFWEDLRISADTVRVSGALSAQPPEYAPIIYNRERGPSYSGIYGFRFGHGKIAEGLFQNCHFHAQLPHKYKTGTGIEPHIHARLDKGSDGAPGQKLLLEFEYTWTNVGEKRPDTTQIITLNHTISNEDLFADNIIISFGLISKPDSGISSMLDCRFSRITVGKNWEHDYWICNGLENDTFEGTLIFKEFDFHYQVDSPGSREQYHK
jgi:hypothetical protein